MTQQAVIAYWLIPAEPAHSFFQRIIDDLARRYDALSGAALGGTARPAGTRHGSTWLRRVLVEVARAAARTRGSYFSAQYSRIARRRGPNKAAVAVANSILAVIWHVLTNGCIYEDPGADYFERRHDPAVEAKRLQARIEALGFDVTLSPKAA